MGEIFISYKQEERERMRPIAHGLRALGVDVWFDERPQPDRSFTEEITQLVQSCKAQLVCWSPAAVASEWVRGEAEKGRQRGILIAVMIEPCDLPPPFNMHHAENMQGWSGDARHNGWRKVCDAIGRKLERPGLGELAALQVSDDATAWKKWAQKYSTDPLVEEAWAKAEELEIGAARQRMVQEREAARRAAEEAERKRAAQEAERQRVAEETDRRRVSQDAERLNTPTSGASPADRKSGGVNPFFLGIGAGVVAAVGAAAFFMVTQQQNTEAAQKTDLPPYAEQLPIETPATKASAPAVDPAPADAPVSAPPRVGPTSAQLSRALVALIEPMGAAHYIRRLCAGNDDQFWRDHVLAITQRESGHNDAIVEAFNRGYRQEEATSSTCTATATELYRRHRRDIFLRASTVAAFYVNPQTQGDAASFRFYSDIVGVAVSPTSLLTEGEAPTTP